MNSDSPQFFATLLHPEFFEPLDRYAPTHDYAAVVQERLPSEWSLRVGGFWTQAMPPDAILQAQGWKIHISATMAHARETLELGVPVLVSECVPFKFASDPLMLQLSMNKNWPRTGSGKFITVYPRDVEQFKAVIAILDEKTRHLAGPYILSDRPYRNSRVVFYRFGEHRGWRSVNALGQRAPILVAPDGRTVSDARQPFFTLPDWVSDPFGGEEVPAPDEAGVLLRERYRVIGAEKHSSIGGIYTAEDTQVGGHVILREARPMVGNLSAGYDGKQILEKEGRILQRLSHTGYLPRFVELFQEWEHWFLVQTKLDAESLWGYAINFYFGDKRPATPEEMFERIRATAIKIGNGLRAVHVGGVVLRDLTRSNVMFDRMTDEVRFIDLEFAYELDRDDPPVGGWTMGYASREQRLTERPTVAEDHYAFGALLLDMLTFSAPGLELNRAGVLAGLDLALADHGLPRSLHDIVCGLTTDDRAKRWDLDGALDALARPAVLRAPRSTFAVPTSVPLLPEPTPTQRAEIAQTVERIATYAEDVADYSRDDRLFPASADVFATNPVSFQYGSSGVAYFLWRARKEVPTRAVDWTLAHITARECPSGFAIGLAGVALTLLELGRSDEAQHVLERSNRKDRVYAAPGLYYGAAGWGLVNLRFWMQTRDGRYLRDAEAAADHLVRAGRVDADGMSWESEGITPLGFGHGGSGVATFLMYMYAANGDARLLATAEQALRFEMAQRSQVGDHLVWHTHQGAPPGDPKSPHMRHGTAGVGTAMIRYYALTRDPEFRQFAEHCAASVAIRFTNKLWYDYGIAGYGEFLLDMYHFLGDERYIRAAYHLSDLLMVYRMERGRGYAFAGLDMARISCDIGLGSAGIGLFLARLLDPTMPRFLLPDDLLQVDRTQTLGGNTRIEGPPRDHALLSTTV